MRILLLGEYSGLHSNLRDGLIFNNHDVTLVGYSDSFKKIPVQINIDSTRKGLIGKLERRIKAFVISLKFKDYDVVQVINPWVFGRLFPYKWLYSRLKKKNRKLFFLAAGTDAFYWKNAESRLNYSPILDMKIIDKGNNHSYMDKSRSYKFNDWCLSISNGIIPIMYDYEVCYENHPKLLKTIPIPININKIKFYGLKNKNQIHIFHGLNRRGIKGTHYIEKAFEILQKKYPNKLKTKIDGRVPLKQYLQLLEDTDIIIDQTSSYSLGMNGLFAMAMGKIVLGGAEPESLSMYKTKMPAINIKPDPDHIVKTIEELLQNEKRLFELSNSSRKFIEEEHNCIEIAKRYIETWEKN